MTSDQVARLFPDLHATMNNQHVYLSKLGRLLFHLQSLCTIKSNEVEAYRNAGNMNLIGGCRSH